MAKSLRSQLYRAARDLGNVEAAEKGPTAYGKRVVRRKAYAKTNGALAADNAVVAQVAARRVEGRNAGISDNGRTGAETPD